MFGSVVTKTVANQGETARALNECALATSLIPFVTPLLLLVSSSRSKNRAYPSMIPVLIFEVLVSPLAKIKTSNFFYQYNLAFGYLSH